MNVDIKVPDELIGAMKTDDEQSVKLLGNLIKPAVEAALRASFPFVIEQTLNSVGHSEDVTGLVSLLAARSNDGKSEVLRKALTLYGLTLDALEKGYRLAVLDSNDVIIHDVIGFDSTETVPNRAR